MFRTSVPNNGGMLFVWEVPQESQMWMKNTLVPLDMVFIDGSGHIHSIARKTTPFSLESVDSHGEITAVLEIRGGRAAEIGAGPGDVVKTPFYHNG